MNVLEARKKWGVSDNTMLQYLSSGMIPDVSVRDGVICIPNDIVPLVPRKGTKIDSVSVRKFILKACNEFKYIDHRILCISADDFLTITNDLEEQGCLKRKKEYTDGGDSRQYIITEKGEECLKKNRFQMNELSLSLSFAYDPCSNIVLPTGQITVKGNKK